MSIISQTPLPPGVATIMALLAEDKELQEENKKLKAENEKLKAELNIADYYQSGVLERISPLLPTDDSPHDIIGDICKELKEHKEAYDFMSIISNEADGVFRFLGEQADDETAVRLVSTKYMSSAEFQCFNPDWSDHHG